MRYEGLILTQFFVITNKLTSAVCRPIASLAAACPTLVDLNLRFNNIDAEGAKIFAEFLRTNRTVTKLALSGNEGIGDEGAIALADVRSFVQFVVEYVV